MDNIIMVNGITVRFNLSNVKVDNLKEYFVRLAKRELMFQEFLALKDVSLNVGRGEAMGIIGPNGSGKSTLLKVISGIIKPYNGTITVRGSIAPLIELGAGFDLNLSARENIYMNGILLGHTRKYISEHFDEIVEFAEVGRFLDSPIKNYSSGMRAKLGFSIATSVKPEILIVDETLAVGDYNFRKKCDERMSKMLEGGATLILVSHSANAVKKLCRRAIWLNKGEIVMEGDAASVCDAYMPDAGNNDNTPDNAVI